MVILKGIRIPRKCCKKAETRHAASKRGFISETRMTTDPFNLDAAMLNTGSAPIT
jgi:hypothetical protein